MRLSVLALVVALSAACGGAPPVQTTPPPPGPNPTTGTRTTPAPPPPLIAAAWPVRTREHLDLWLHAYALISPDTTLIPYFRRNYRDRLLTVRRQRGVTTQLDAERERLAARLAQQPSLATSGQFVPLYFSSWDQLRQGIDLLVRAEGNPRAASDPTQQRAIAILASVFPTPADREWARAFAAAADDEWRRFYHDYWTTQVAARSAIVAHADSLWQRQWRPALQRFLNNTQQQNGELLLSLPLGGEGRTIKSAADNVVAVIFPETIGEADQVLYVMAHEAAGAVASTAVDDNTTPAERRTGAAQRYEQSAAVRAGALLLERTLPAMVPGYMRFYLQAAGRVSPTDPRNTFVTTFAIPDAVRDALTRQIEIVLGGI